MVEYPAGTQIGLLSDSHGRAETTQHAVDQLVEAGADVLLHLGDVGDDRVLDALAGHRAHVVFGNCDYDWENLAEYAAFIGLTVDHPCGRILVGDRVIVFSHGHRAADMTEAIESGLPFFCSGHTHQASDTLVEKTRLINPGALFRASCYTVALLEPISGAVTFLEVPRSEG